MGTADIVGFIGVSMIIIAFFLNLTNFISIKSLSYILMNFIGVWIACYASILLKYVPFIILEGNLDSCFFRGFNKSEPKKIVKIN